MLINTDNDSGVFYDAMRVQAHFMDQVWYEVPAERFLPDKFTKIARCGRYSFYADPDPNDHDNRRYCVVDRGL